MNTENIETHSAEQAYHSLAKYALDFIAGREWESSVISAQVTSGAVTFFEHSLLRQGEKIELSAGWGNNNILRLATSAVRFLRDNLLATTGQRIWGLTFTLYPDGKFNIQYDYNKPEGYEETDEVITGDEISRLLGDFGKKSAR